jgi:hypothetical protein
MINVASLTRYHDMTDETNLKKNSFNENPMSSWVDTKALLEWRSFELQGLFMMTSEVGIGFTGVKTV